MEAHLIHWPLPVSVAERSVGVGVGAERSDAAPRGATRDSRGDVPGHKWRCATPTRFEGGRVGFAPVHVFPNANFALTWVVLPAWIGSTSGRVWPPIHA